jgi:hypothetical protein
MSAAIYCKFFYVGAGGLNCVWTQEGDEVFYAAVIDCGSSGNAGFDKKVSLSVDEVHGILQKAENIEVFITHADVDHYNLISKLLYDIPKKNVYSIYIGSSYNSRVFCNHIANGVLKELKSKVKRIPRKTVMAALAYIRIGEEEIMQIYALFGNWGSEINGQSTIYGLRTKRNVYIFTGDATYTTFSCLNSVNAQVDLSDFIGFRNLYMTIPHHGSVKTLIKKSQTVNIFGDTIVDFTFLCYLFINSNLDLGTYFASAGLKYAHPNYATMAFFHAIASDDIIGPDQLVAFNNRCIPYIEGCVKKRPKFHSTINANIHGYGYMESYNNLYGSLIYWGNVQSLNDEIEPFSFFTGEEIGEIGAHEIISSTESNDDSYKIVTYDRKLRPYFTDSFRKTTNDLGETETVSTREYHQTFGGERID